MLIKDLNLPQHQEVISDFIYHIRQNLVENGQMYDYFVAPELKVKNDSFNDGSIIPDIVVRSSDNSWNQPVLIIEISRTRGYLSNIKKARKAVKNIRSLQEGFVFNYETGEGCRITKPDFDEEDGESYSNVLDFNLIDCLR